MHLVESFSGKVREKQHATSVSARAGQWGAAGEEPGLHLPAPSEKAFLACTDTPHVPGHTLIIMINIYIMDGLPVQCYYLANEGDGTHYGANCLYLDHLLMGHGEVHPLVLRWVTTVERVLQHTDGVQPGETATARAEILMCEL